MQLDFFHDPKSSDLAPLASRVRPSHLEAYQGQGHILGPGKPLRKLLDSGSLPCSLVFWGPPGCGKTTLAHLIANCIDAHLDVLSAVESGVKELRALVDRSRARGGANIVFIDEIHRYTKTQQDALLPHLESGLLRLIGATTENPRSCLTPALLSRCKIHRLHPLEPSEMANILEQACQDPKGLGKLQPQLDKGVVQRLVQRARGDARLALNLLEQALLSSPLNDEGRPHLKVDWIDEQLQEKFCHYSESDHHACTSALIKSIRGSDPDATLYWLARMVAGGEPVDYIARRLRIAASEDIGLADPHAIMHTQACCQSAEAVGYPEARYPLAQAALYLSLAPKSDSLNGFFTAEALALKTDRLPVPDWLAPGGDYHNPHREPLHFRRVPHLPKELEGTTLFEPGSHGYEAKLRLRIEQLWEKPPSNS